MLMFREKLERVTRWNILHLVHKARFNRDFQYVVVTVELAYSEVEAAGRINK